MTDRPPLPPETEPFAVKLAFLRQHHRPRLTQGALARKMGRTDQMGGQWERGPTEPTNDIKLKMAELFDVDPEYLGWEPDEAAVPVLSTTSPSMAEDVAYMRLRLDLMQQDIAAIAAALKVDLPSGVHA